MARPLTHRTDGAVRRGLPAAAVAVALLAASCGGSQPPAAEREDPAPTGEAPAPVPTEQNAAPAAEPPDVADELRFTAPLLGGGMLRGAEYAGRDVAVWFWAPW